MTTASTAGYVPFRENRFLQVLCVAFLAVWVASAIHPDMVIDWWLENSLVFFFVALLIVAYRWLPFSDLSYLLLFLFLCLHEWGAHHKYASVPLGIWMQELFHTSRNHYDRVVHFAFGLLFAYPQRELLMRKVGVRGSWTFSLPVVASLALGAAYEIIEAIVASMVSPDAADAFLGFQGDIWDTQKDMACVFTGALLAMCVTATVVWRRRGQKRQPAEAATGR